jgi:hypothetical protein
MNVPPEGRFIVRSGSGDSRFDRIVANVDRGRPAITTMSTGAKENFRYGYPWQAIL